MENYGYPLGRYFALLVSSAVPQHGRKEARFQYP